jgi:hypothetical protein
MTEQGIIWLASYPKSGNTWLRVFMSNYLADGDEPVDINELDSVSIASSRPLFDRFTGVSSGNLTFDEIDRLRPNVYTHMVADTPETIFLKVHDAYLYLVDGRAIFPPEATKGIIYIIRNPLDVVVSFSHYSRRELDDTVAFLADETSTLASKTRVFKRQYRQKLLSWSSHVRSWNTVPNIPRLLIRYEDMSIKPEATFGSVVRFLGEAVEANRLKKSIRFSSFDIVSKQERQEGFRAKPFRVEHFFRKGKTGGWREVLTHEQVASVVRHHGSTMEDYGYL